MKQIALFGAGKSATCLIDYLIMQAPRQKWHITVADTDPSLIRHKTGKSYYATPAVFDVRAAEARQQLISASDVVISLLPPPLHVLVAKDCIRFRRHLLTASYIGPEMRRLEREIREAGILFMAEMGLDPGIDHMSAMKLIHSIEKKGGIIHSFRSFCGGLVPREFNNNPWHYKIAWNPRNIVLAGNGGALYKEKGKVREIGYNELFTHVKTVEVPGLGKLSYYPNRDSLAYEALYRLRDIPTFLRATLRYPDFCEGWHALVSLGLTDDRVQRDTDRLTYAEWTMQRLRPEAGRPAEEQVAAYLQVRGKSKIMKQLKYLGLLDNIPVNRGKITNAALLQAVLEERLSMGPDDRDMVVMQHEIAFERRNISTKLTSYMIVTGQDNVHTAMAKTVGYPLGILAKLILDGKVKLKGLHIPVLPEVYNPVLKELEQHEMAFEETFE